MSMEINSIYSSYEGNYTNSANSKKQLTEEADTSKETGSNTTRKTATDELSYLSGKYSNYSFVAANYTKGIQYGKSSTINVAISPQFLAKMANDNELEKEYEGYISDMQRLDEQFAAQQAAIGWRVEQGWIIDKDGGISKWIIGHKDPNAKSHLQTMSENAVKIRERNAEKRNEKKKIEEKRKANSEEKAELKEKMQKAGKVQFGDRFKDAITIWKDNENMAVSKDGNKNSTTDTGLNMDIKA